MTTESDSWGAQVGLVRVLSHFSLAKVNLVGETKTRSRRMAGGWTIALGALVILAVAAAATVMILNRDRTAMATAQEYFEALADGDAAAANSLSLGWQENEDIVSLLTDEMLGNAVEHISEVSVVPDTSPGVSSEGAVVVSYTLAGDRYTVPLSLNKGKPEWGLLRTWQLNPPFSQTGTLPRSASQQILLAGTPIEADVEEVARVTLFPAVYRLVTSESDYLELSSDELVVNGVDEFPSVEFTPTPALVALVQEHVNQILDECVENSVDSGGARGCPLLAFPPGGALTDGTWEIITYPTVELTQIGPYTQFYAPGGRAQFTPQDGGSAIEMARDIEYSGSVDVVGEKVQVEVIPQ